ncbi:MULTISPECIES: signal peptidase I [unclassified Nocardioides]|uniref:signal peptidase I n=1 Tax=unclassified Nocardioides TaxID=2615069 RepID=UPI00301534C9
MIRVLRAASWVVFLAGLAVLTVAVVIPRVAGATPYTILTGSMQPHMPPGTLVVTRPVDPEDITIGSVVTYQLESGEAAVVTHRVIGIGVDGAGEPAFRTQGDANDVADALPVRAEQIRGERWYAVPYVGRLGTLVGQDLRRMLVPLVGIALLGYAAVRLIGESRHARRRPRRSGGAHVAAPR